MTPSTSNLLTFIWSALCCGYSPYMLKTNYLLNFQLFSFISLRIILERGFSGTKLLIYSFLYNGITPTFLKHYKIKLIFLLALYHPLYHTQQYTFSLIVCDNFCLGGKAFSIISPLKNSSISPHPTWILLFTSFFILSFCTMDPRYLQHATCSSVFSN